MSLETVLATCQKLNAQVEMLAAIGAEMCIRKDGLTPDPDVHALLKNVVNAADPQLLDGIEPAQEAMALAFITSFFRQAQDLEGLGVELYIAHHRQHAAPQFFLSRCKQSNMNACRLRCVFDELHRRHLVNRHLQTVGTLNPGAPQWMRWAQMAPT